MFELKWFRLQPLFEGTCLFAILALGAYLRFHDLKQRGLFFWDEAKFALEGLRMYAALQALQGSRVPMGLGKAVGTAKPSHALLTGLAYTVLGQHDYAALALNAASSLTAIAVLYFIARWLFSPLIALFTALLQSISAYDIQYARSALTESDATCIFLLGVLLWTRSGPLTPAPVGGRKRALHVSAALLLGLAFTTNYRLSVYIASLVLFDLAWSARHAGWRPTLKRSFLWMVCLSVAPLVWESIDALTAAHGMRLFRGDLVPGMTSYLRQAIYQIHEGKQAVLRFNPAVYAQWYVVRQGLPLSLLVVFGVVVALYRRLFPWMVPMILVVLPCMLYVIAPFIVPRNLVPALPFTVMLAVAGAVSLRDAPEAVARLWPAIVTLILLLSMSGIGRALEVGQERSGFAHASAYIERHGHGRALTSSEIMVFYLRGRGAQCLTPALPSSISEIGGYIQQGYLYAVLDEHHNTWITRYIRRHATLAARFPTFGRLHLGENPVSSENGNPPKGNAPTEYVDVYSLRTLKVPRTISHPPPCSMDEVI